VHKESWVEKHSNDKEGLPRIPTRNGHGNWDKLLLDSLSCPVCGVSHEARKVRTAMCGFRVPVFQLLWGCIAYPNLMWSPSHVP
jgi:hypothetical protein